MLGRKNIPSDHRLTSSWDPTPPPPTRCSQRREGCAEGLEANCTYQQAGKGWCGSTTELPLFGQPCEPAGQVQLEVKLTYSGSPASPGARAHSPDLEQIKT